MKSWEFKKIKEYDGQGPVPLPEVMWEAVEQAGLNGWELVNVLYNKHGEVYFFKREME